MWCVVCGLLLWFDCCLFLNSCLFFVVGRWSLVVGRCLLFGDECRCCLLLSLLVVDCACLWLFDSCGALLFVVVCCVLLLVVADRCL